MALPLALAALLILILAAPAAAAFLVGLRLHRKLRLVPPLEPAAAALEPPAPAEEEESADEGGREKRRRRKARRKQQQKGGEEAADAAAGGEEALLRRPRFPLASVAGALQRRITARYDDLVRASQAQSLTVDQVHEFINCLVDARNELLQKSENVQRSFRIKKAMLSNAQNNRRSSYDHLRLCQQVHKLESEHERLKKDAAVYNHLQEQLQMSPSYKLMMELHAEMEKEAREHALATEAPEISFEELLAQEKKDAAFWQRNGKLRSISGK